MKLKLATALIFLVMLIYPITVISTFILAVPFLAVTNDRDAFRDMYSTVFTRDSWAGYFECLRNPTREARYLIG
jgi:hypothetical protein